MAKRTPPKPLARSAGTPAPELWQRLAELGRTIGAREASHRRDLEDARSRGEKLRALVLDAIERFHESAARAGAPHLRIEVGDLRLDDKHVRAVEFDLLRGRHRAVVTLKGRGEVTLVGPFHAGKTEGPCRTFPFSAEPELNEALAEFLEQFLEAASAP